MLGFTSSLKANPKEKPISCRTSPQRLENQYMENNLYHGEHFLVHIFANKVSIRWTTLLPDAYQTFESVTFMLTN